MALRVPISFEFFPPKTDEQRDQLDRSVQRLKAHAPEYVSCTFGAGGSTLDYTPETVARLHDGHGLEAAPHISCVGGTRAELSALLRRHGLDVTAVSGGATGEPYSTDSRRLAIVAERRA